MDGYSPLLIAIIATTFFVAGVVKGVTGMGLPTLAMGVLGALLSPLAAASLLLVPSFVTNVWQLAAGPSLGTLIRRLWPMMAAIAVGTALCSSLLVGGESRLLTACLGATLVIYATYTLFAHQLAVPPKLELWLSPAVGAATGAITGGTGVLVIPAVPYLQALQLQKDDLVQALGLSFTVSTIALAAGLAGRDAVRMEALAISALAVIPALAGMWAGQLLRERISPATFRRWFLIALLILGIEMASRLLR
jgi:uncharacterized membrane protein YfcA